MFPLWHGAVVNTSLHVRRCRGAVSCLACEKKLCQCHTAASVQNGYVPTDVPLLQSPINMLHLVQSLSAVAWSKQEEY
jgi:hypothetical protein